MFSFVSQVKLSSVEKISSLSLFQHHPFLPDIFHSLVYLFRRKSLPLSFTPPPPPGPHPNLATCYAICQIHNEKISKKIKITPKDPESEPPRLEQMIILFPESVPANMKRLIQELVQGHEYATKLKFLLQKPIGSDGSVSAEELVTNVLRSFTEGLSVLTSSEGGSSGGDEVAQNLPNSGENGSQVADSSESMKRSLPATKDRRGSYKRRKTEQTWTKVSETIDDNHAWRKYGQKEILNSKFPRSYFRCTRKYDQGCRAAKQVQRIEENPDMYQITYIGLHTCKDTLKAPQMVNYSDSWDSFLVNSHPDSKVPNEQDPPISSQTPTIKQEYPKEDTPSDLTGNLDPSLWSDLKDFELSKPTIMPLKMASDNADTVYSCTDSQSLDMDFGVFSSDFSTDFHFDESLALIN